MISQTVLTAGTYAFRILTHRCSRHERQLAVKRARPGRIHVYTGEGKGKTTAALGLALRAAGAGMKVCIIQFLKARRCGEHAALERFAGQITIRSFGTGSFVKGRPGDEDRRLAHEGLAEAKRALAGKYQLVVLDEACVAVSLNLFSVDELLSTLQSRKKSVEVVLTGRGASRKLVKCADLVTEMKEVKHYMHNGVRAREGIEF